MTKNIYIKDDNIHIEYDNKDYIVGRHNTTLPLDIEKILEQIKGGTYEENGNDSYTITC